MSDIEEPPSKLSKFEQTASCNDSAEEGQEEWLSEGILTDDDYNANENEQSELGNMSHDDTMQSLESENQPNEMSIEETLNTLDSTANTETSYTDELEKYLIKKPDVIDDKKENDDDNNSTDYLLKMLEDKTEDAEPEDKTVVDESSTDDDLDNILAKGNVTNISSMIKSKVKTAPLAAPEDTTDTDSSDVAGTMNKMFLHKSNQSTKESNKQAIKPPRRQNAIKSTAKPSTTQTKRIHFKEEQTNKLTTSTPVRRETRSSTSKSVSKNDSQSSKLESKPSQAEKSKTSKQSNKQPSKSSRIMQIKQAEPNKIIHMGKAKQPSQPSKLVGKPTGTVSKSAPVQTPLKMKSKDQSIIKENETVKKKTDDDFDRLLNETVEENKHKDQDIMKPEVMDEEALSDEYSLSEGSFYDEIMSSDSGSDLEDWFTIDLRAEKAGEYLPLLGSRARSMLLEEKRRVSARVAALRRGLAALAGGARAQAARLRDATAELAELDATLMAN